MKSLYFLSVGLLLSAVLLSQQDGSTPDGALVVCQKETVRVERLGGPAPEALLGRGACFPVQHPGA